MGPSMLIACDKRELMFFCLWHAPTCVGGKSFGFF